MSYSRILFLFFCFYLVVFSGLNAQQSKRDSLIWKFNKSTDPNKKANLALQIAHANQSTDKIVAINYADQCVYYAKKNGNDTLAGDGMNMLGTIYYINGDFDQARLFYTQAVDYYKKSGVKLNIATSINNVGLTYINQGRYSEGLKYQFESLAIYDSIDYEQGIARAYNAIAVVYNELGSITKDFSNYQNALIYLRKSLTMCKKAKDNIGYNNILINIGNAYRSMAVYDSALYYYQMGEAMADSLSDGAAHSNCLGNIADVFYLQGKYEEAITNGEQALEEKITQGDQLGQASVYIILSMAYQKTGEEKKAFDYLVNAYNLAEKAGAVKEQSMAARMLAKQQAEKGNYNEAWQLLDTYADLQDSIVSVENKQIIQELKRFTDEDQKKQIELLTQKSLIADLKSNRQSQFLTFSIIGFVLLLILAIMIYSRFLVKKRANQDLQQAYATIEEKNKNITDSIHYAKNLQEAILPSAEHIRRLFPNHFIFYRPKDIVAGDFYWAEEYEGCIYIAAADCTGHGVPGALVSVVCSKALREAVFQHQAKAPGKILDKARELVLETFDRRGNEVHDGMDISLACWNPSTRELKWAGANNPLVLFSNGEMNLLLPDKQAVGRSEAPKPFTTQVLSLPNETMIYLFTDGYADQFGGEKGKKFKKKQLLDYLQQIASQDCREQESGLENMFTAWKGKLEQVDDVLVIGVKI